MSARRRRSPSLSSSTTTTSSQSGSPVRVVRGNSARLSARTSSPGGSQNVSIGASRQTSGSRVRRPTPVAIRRSTDGSSGRRRVPANAENEGNNNADNDNTFDSSGSNEEQNEGTQTRRRQVTIDTNTQEIGDEPRPSSRRFQVTSSSVAASAEDDGEQLSWYERLMPECLLNWTAPLTGYERQLEAGELDERQFELLERERLRRNRRVRRRLMVMLAVASIASAYFFYRGRVPMRRPQGIRGSINEVAHRIEDGFSKTFHDTMGK